MNRRIRPLAAATILLGAVAAAMAISPRGCAAGPVVRGRVVGPVAPTAALLVDPRAGLLVPLKPGPDGSFVAQVPAGAIEPTIVLEAGGGALVQTGALPTEAGPEVSLRPLAIWKTDVRVKIDPAGWIRLDWWAVPSAEGFPRTVRYSILVDYVRLDGTEHQASFPTETAQLTLDPKAMADFLREHDPARPDVTVTLRALELGDTSGTWWHGAKVRWRLGTEQVTPAP